MKKTSVTFMVASLMGLALLRAGSMVYVYQNEASVLNGPSWLGTVTAEGVLITADQALSAQMKPVIGYSDGTLAQGSLSRLDNEINAALIKKGEMISKPDLIAAHKKRFEGLQAFLPQPATSASSRLEPVTVASAETPPVASVDPEEDGEVFQLRINGEPLGSDPLILSKKKKKSEFKLDIVNVSTQSFWRTELRLEATPRLSFWKKGRKKGLNDIPRPVFKYNYQSFFKRMEPGDSFTIPIEVFYIKKDAYEWTFTLKSKGLVDQKKVQVQFQS